MISVTSFRDELPIRSGVALMIPVVLGAVLAILLVRFFLGSTETAFENFGLGPETSPVFAVYDGRPIHCQGVSDADLCISRLSDIGKRSNILWLGNSQLHGVNQYQAGEETAPLILLEAVLPNGVDLVAFSQANANFQEHYVLYEYLSRRIPLTTVWIGVVFDDLREMGLRADIRGALYDPDTVSALQASEVGRQLLLSNAGGAQADNAGPLTGTFQQTSEAFLNDALAAHIDLWARRPDSRGRVLISLYHLRNAVFWINPGSKRPVIAGRYHDNLAAFEAMLASASARGIQVVAYIVPLRNDVDTPYLSDEYERFKADVEDIVERQGAVYSNLESVVAPEHWGRTGEQDDAVTLDFMHFRASGHRLLATALQDVLEAMAAGAEP